MLKEINLLFYNIGWCNSSSRSVIRSDSISNAHFVEISINQHSVLPGAFIEIKI